MPVVRSDARETAESDAAEGEPQRGRQPRGGCRGEAAQGRPAQGRLPAEGRRTLRRVAALKPAYLVCGDDDAKIDAWRARVRRRAEDERGPGGLEVFDARQSDPAEVVGSLAMLSFDTAMR